MSLTADGTSFSKCERRVLLSLKFPRENYRPTNGFAFPAESLRLLSSVVVRLYTSIVYTKPPDSVRQISTVSSRRWLETPLQIRANLKYALLKDVGAPTWTKLASTSIQFDHFQVQFVTVYRMKRKVKRAKFCIKYTNDKTVICGRKVI